jgi:hypothetical protein
MTPNQYDFITYQEVTKGRLVHDAGNHSHYVTSIGIVKLKVLEGIIKVQDVHHIPGIHASLLSFSLLKAQGFNISLVNMVPKHFQVTSLDNTSFQIYANPTCGTYQVNTKGANS